MTGARRASSWPRGAVYARTRLQRASTSSRHACSRDCPPNRRASAKRCAPWPGSRSVRALAILIAAAVSSRGGTHASSYAFHQVLAGLAQPVALASAPGDPTTLYVVEQRGTGQIVRDGAVAGTYLDIRDRVLDDGERGLLSIAFDPGYATNHYAYVDYVDKDNVTHVARFTNGDAATEHDLLTVQQPYPNLKGGQLAFDKAGRLYVGMGDGGTNSARDGDRAIGDPENRAQSKTSKLGRLLRTKPGSGVWQTIGYGLRNPWRFSLDRATGSLWIGDVGAAKVEEIDFRPAAKLNTVANYGWSHWEGDLICN